MTQGNASSPEKLKQELGLGDEAGHAQIRECFSEAVKARTETPQDVATEERLNRATSALEELCALYFAHNMEQLKSVAAMSGAMDSKNDHADAAMIKTEAGAIARNLEKHMTGFAVCALRIEGAKAFLEAEITQALAGTQEEHKETEWSYDLPRQMAMMCRRRDMLTGYMERIGKARPLVTQIDRAFRALEQNLLDLLTPEKAQGLIAEFVGLLRKRSFREAKALIRDTARRNTNGLFRLRKKERKDRWKTICEAFEVIADFVAKLAPRLAGRQDTLFLRDWEVKLAYEDMVRQLEATRDFIAKFQVAEIRFRRNALDTERQKLYEISSFGAYMDLLDQLRKGSLFPMKTMKDVRKFESEILNKVRYVIAEEAKSVGQIDARIARLRLPPDPGSIDAGEIDLFEDSGAQAGGAA